MALPIYLVVVVRDGDEDEPERRHREGDEVATAGAGDGAAREPVADAGEESGCSGHGGGEDLDTYVPADTTCARR